MSLQTFLTHWRESKEDKNPQENDKEHFPYQTMVQDVPPGAIYEYVAGETMRFLKLKDQKAVNLASYMLCLAIDEKREVTVIGTLEEMGI